MDHLDVQLLSIENETLKFHLIVVSMFLKPCSLG